ncbi:MAG: retron system putative HNH endonuclease [Polyangiales bacterium]
MILIRKGREPDALTTYRRAPDTSVDPPRAARYDGPGFEAVKPSVRDALVAEQRGVCCYCNGRITATPTGMKIEHRVAQSVDETRDLEWKNLLGACKGEVDAPGGRGARSVHCDASKGDASIDLDPTEPSHVSAISFTRDGRVTSSRAEHQRELDGPLNLNHPSVITRRRNALDEIKLELNRKYPGRSYSATALSRLRDQYQSAAGQAPPFVGYLCWWLERAIRSKRGQ